MTEETELLAPEAESIEPNRIRVETALSRFPIHRLAKKDTVSIDLQQLGENGDPDFKWEVTHNQKYGQPGPLAYKVDTLIVNRRIDDSGRPVPGMIKLGTLTELCTALGLSDSGENRSNIKKALHQNASAYITAKFRYRTKSGNERRGEMGYTRYSVVFTGERLPGDKVADAVYIIPNSAYREFLDLVEVRPLDYDYLVMLTPGAQRFYELLSYQMYAALTNDRPRARLRYSQYCARAPQTRNVTFDQVKKQMFKIHAPHRDSGYIEKIEYVATVDEEGVADWDMLYTPGPKAVVEFKAFNRRQLGSNTTRGALLAPDAVTKQLPVPGSEPIVAELIRRGVTSAMAIDLASNIEPDQYVIDQLEYVDSLVANDTRGKLTNPPGLYIKYVRENLLPPESFMSSRKKNELIQKKQERIVRSTSGLKNQKAYDEYCMNECRKFLFDEMFEQERETLIASKLQAYRNMLPTSSEEEHRRYAEEAACVELRSSGRVPMVDFTEFSETKVD